MDQSDSAASSDPALPLAGIRVADFTHVISGPFCAQILGDLGACVTKIEGADRGDIGRDITPSRNGQSHYFTAFNRNKRSIAWDLKSAGGLDLVAQAYSGMMSTNGMADGPPLRIGVPIGDTSASLFASIGILAALYRRRTTGAGEHLDIGMFDCLLSLLANYGGHVRATGAQPERSGSLHYYTVPYGAFDAADGQIIIAAMTDTNWRQLCRALALDALAADTRLATGPGRAEHRDEIHAVLMPLLRRHSVLELVERLDAADVPCAPVNDIAAALRHPHAAARGMNLDLAHPAYGALTATATPLGSLTRSANTAPPLRGEHTVTVLRELGLTEAAIESLLASSDAWQESAAAPAPSA